MSVQIIDKSSGGYCVVQTIGSSRDQDTIERLVRKAHAILHPVNEAQPSLFPTILPEDAAVENFLDSVSGAHIRTVGPDLIFGTLFDRMGFCVVPHELFRHLVIARLAYPGSKLKTVDYLRRYKGVETEVHTIYRFLDTLKNTYKQDVERVVYEHTQKTLGTITIVFYDMTTLYFEAEDEDELRKIGFSKDGKSQHPQIMLGLLVGSGGYPIGYDIFEGNTFEGHTLIPMLETMQKKYRFEKPVVVADAALLSKDNIAGLKKDHYTFILGARLKNEAEEMKSLIWKRAQGIQDGENFTLDKKDGTRLVVTYSEKRAKKDRHNREKGLTKLRERVKSGKLTKASINNRGYNKFLTLTGSIEVAVDDAKVEADTRWDGLKGYVTNTTLSAEKIVEHYGHLWQIERAFRISKTDLRIRPIFHYRKRRIEAHICICFVAYAIYKELECLLVKHKAGFSPERAVELTHTIYELEYVLPQSKELRRRTLKMDDEQQVLYEATRR